MLIAIFTDIRGVKQLLQAHRSFLIPIIVLLLIFLIMQKADKIHSTGYVALLTFCVLSSQMEFVTRSG